MTSCRTTRRARPMWSSCSRGAGTSSRASPTAATTTSPSTPNHSGEKLDYFDQATNERYIPHVIEPAAGATRAAMAFLMASYDEEEVKGETRVVLHLHHRIAPYKVAVLPLSKKEELAGPAREVLAHAAAQVDGASSTTPSRSAAGTAARTSSARRTA